jgi:hypothetical protein
VQKIKLTMVGEVKVSSKSGKNFREIGAEEFNGEKRAAFDRVANDFAQFKAGDEVEVELSENGKYINKVQKVGGGGVPTPGFGGKGFSKVGFSKDDPEKNISVYTSYVLNHMIDFKAMKLTPEQAVDQIFKVRELVKGRL